MGNTAKWITIFWACLYCFGCTGGPEVQPPPPPQGGEQSPRPTDKPGEGGGGLFDDAGEEDEPGSTKIDYPVLTYFGTGEVTHGGRSLNTDIELATGIDDEELEVESFRANISCSGINGCEQSEVDAESGKLEGKDVYTRVVFEDRKDLSDDYKESRYAIFANKIESKDGRVFTLEDPLPVYPWPAAKSRYEPLESGTATFETTVTASPPVGNKRTFNARVRVSLESLSDSEAELEFDLRISDDSSHEIYGIFPIPRNTKYTIDIEERLIVEVQMTSLYKGKEAPEQAKLRFRLCSSELESGTETFSCR